jgi:hypothetical protein
MIKVHSTDCGFTYPVFPAHSDFGKTPDHEKLLESIDPTPYMYCVGKDQKGNDIMNCLVGVGSPNIHTVYRYNDGTWKLLYLQC